jgi:hypothetical protein
MIMRMFYCSYVFLDFGTPSCSIPRKKINVSEIGCFLPQKGRNLLQVAKSDKKSAICSISEVKVKQSRYRPGVAQRVPGS